MTAVSNAQARIRSLVTSTSMFGEEVIYYPQSDLNAPETIVCGVHWADESGDHSTRGDGRSSLNQDRGRKIRKTVTLEVDSSRKFNENGKDMFELTDPDGNTIKVWLQRRDGTDPSTQSLICVRSKEHAAQKGRRDG